MDLIFLRGKKFLKIKKDFYYYVISVPKKYENQVGFDEKRGIGHVIFQKKKLNMGLDMIQKQDLKEKMLVV
ncbi:MAG: hypothetical protein SVM80_11025 [Halobacteriota archaeon]|nr:hypothetical protein [Halobacteriota archaeon]